MCCAKRVHARPKESSLAFSQGQQARSAPPQRQLSTKGVAPPARKQSGQLETAATPNPSKQVLRTPPPAFRPVVSPVASRPERNVGAALRSKNADGSQNGPSESASAAAAPAQTPATNGHQQGASEPMPNLGRLQPSKLSPSASHAQPISSSGAAAPDAVASPPSQPLSSIFGPSTSSATSPGAPVSHAPAADGQSRVPSSSAAVLDGSPHALQPSDLDSTMPAASMHPAGSERNARGTELTQNGEFQMEAPRDPASNNTAAPPPDQGTAMSRAAAVHPAQTGAVDANESQPEMPTTSAPAAVGKHNPSQQVRLLLPHSSHQPRGITQATTHAKWQSTILPLRSPPQGEFAPVRNVSWEADLLD